MATNKFFAKFPEFSVDVTAPLLDEFERLSISRQWKPGSKKYKKEKSQCIIHEANFHFDKPATKLEGWQALLEELHVTPVPGSISAQESLDQFGRFARRKTSRNWLSTKICLKARITSIYTCYWESMPQKAG